MELVVRYFGLIKEQTSVDKETFEYRSDDTVKSIVLKLTQKYPAIEAVKFQVALNNRFVDSEVKLPEGSEISLMPPFAGG